MGVALWLTTQESMPELLLFLTGLRQIWNLELDLLTLLEQLHLLEQLQLQLHPHQLQPHHLDVVPHNGPQMNGVMMKTTMLIAIMMEALVVPMLSEVGTPTALIVNARIQIMLRTVLTFGQPRSAKGEGTKEDVTDNGSKKIVKRPVRFVKLSCNDL